MKIIDEILTRAKKIKGKIVLPEANMDKRVYDACKIIIKENISDIIVLGKSSDFDAEFISPRVEIIDIEKYADIENMIDSFYELRKNKGITKEDSRLFINRPEYFATMLIHHNVADAMVLGAKFTTADSLRPALQIIKSKGKGEIVSGAMLMLKDDCEPLCFSDVALNLNPTSEELVSIATAGAELMKKVLNINPKVAMLSYSTNGSGTGDMVEKVILATKIAKSKSNYLIDGEMQVDAALDTAVAKQKGLNSKVAGQANVLIFPDINAGNIGYKLVARLGEYKAIGPIMMNFNKPVNDLSRGCTVDEIVNTVAITKLLI